MAFYLPPQQSRVNDQGLFILKALWKNKNAFPSPLAVRLAESRGFSPLALAFQRLFPPGGAPDISSPHFLRDTLGPNRMWGLEWEESVFHTILIFELGYRKQPGLLKRLLLSDRLDFLNSCLCGDLLRDQG